MIYVGIDDTDTYDAPGTNQFARALAAELSDHYRCMLIVRHQLLQDPRVPCTKHNSAASMLLLPHDGARDSAITDQIIASLIGAVRRFVQRRFVQGSDPGFCVTAGVPQAVTAFGRSCQRELVTQQQARRLAGRYGVHLEGCGGTNDGVIGALAAVGLVAEGDDGRVVQIGDWPDSLAGPQDVETLHRRGVEVRCLQRDRAVPGGRVDVGKHLRPNYRAKRIVLFARPEDPERCASGRWRAVRLT
ncbi:MAG: hypothetical protein JXB62_00680 [Pirellulales bacterium]|nr:hypothetical protein [Pirellulales bacterium]